MIRYGAGYAWGARIEGRHAAGNAGFRQLRAVLRERAPLIMQSFLRSLHASPVTSVPGRGSRRVPVTFRTTGHMERHGDVSRFVNKGWAGPGSAMPTVAGYAAKQGGDMSGAAPGRKILWGGICYISGNHANAGPQHRVAGRGGGIGL